jgi:hypothetical protein
MDDPGVVADQVKIILKTVDESGNASLNDNQSGRRPDLSSWYQVSWQSVKDSGRGRTPDLRWGKIGIWSDHRMHSPPQVTGLVQGEHDNIMRRVVTK